MDTFYSKRNEGWDNQVIQIFKTIEGNTVTVPSIMDNAWICLTNPTNEEIMYIAEECNIDADDVQASLDEEEASRIEITDYYTLILVDIPSKEIRSGNNAYTTIPLAIIFTERVIVTVCLENTIVLKPFINGKIKGFKTSKRMRFIYQILYTNTSVYLHYLRKIDKKREEIESRLNHATRNTDLIELHELECDLVYFATSLRVNGVVLDKLTRYERIKQYAEDKELLNDVIIENKQAIEMANIYRDILNGTRELFASVIDNSLNTVMKFLTSITVIMAIPTIVSGFYGMNVNEVGMPFSTEANGFLYICIITLIICAITVMLLKRKDLL